MRRILPFLCIIGLLLLTASPLYAGAIVNKSNQSADYFRSLNRNASTDYADIVVFNPAGTMKMDDGGYVKLDVMYIQKDYSNTISGTVPLSPGELSQDEPSIVPGFFALYKSGKWSGFFAFTIPGGGGEVNWNNGSATSVALNLALGAPLAGSAPAAVNAEGVYYGYTLGGAFAFNDVWSLSAGVRYIDAEKSGNISLPATGAGAQSYQFKQTADGWGGFLGLNIAPTEELNIGLTYFHKTKLDFSTTASGTAAITGVIAVSSPNLINGTSEREDLPGQINSGVSYQFTENLRVETDLTYYLEKEATWDNRLNGEGNSWEWGIMGEWTFNPQWKASLGFLYSNIDVDPNNILAEAPELTAQSFGAGAVWDINPNLALTFGAVKVWYDGKTGQLSSLLPPTFTADYDKDVLSIFAGIQWKFL